MSMTNDARRCPQGLAAGLLACLALMAATGARADAEPAPAFKLTLGHYHYSDQGAGTDLNLRWRKDDNSLWIGHYRDPVFGAQARIGGDAALDLGGDWSLQPSLQAATGGFVGGSVNLQWGSRWFGLVGWGRTNLRPYYNLNFDPNDAISLGAGLHDEHGGLWSATWIADDRLHTGQRHLHLSGRWTMAGQRVFVDLLRKTGQGDAGPVRAWGWTLGLDGQTLFLRLARDPRQNFSGSDATRVSLGLRF